MKLAKIADDTGGSSVTGLTGVLKLIVSPAGIGLAMAGVGLLTFAIIAL